MENFREEDYLRVGVLSNTHGIAGEMKVYPTTDDVTRFKKLKEAVIDNGKEQVAVHISSVKFFKNMAILKFKEFSNINEVEKYKGHDLLVHRKHAVALKEDEYFICDIIGAKVLTEDGEEFGTLKEVMTTGANDVYSVVTKSGKEVLLPVIKECVLSIDTEKKEVVVHLMKGLLD